MFNELDGWCCERAVFDSPHQYAASRPKLVSLERGRPLSAFELVAFSIAFELDVPHIPHMLELSGIPPLARDRGAGHPFVLAGGPMSQSNVLPLAPFVDAVVIGDAEETLPALMAVYDQQHHRHDLLLALAELPGVWVPSIHNDCTCDVVRAPEHVLPAVGQFISPKAELSNMFLIEASRGCPRMCTFCVVRATVSPMRASGPEAALAAVPPWAPRVGFVGAAVSDYAHVKTLLQGVIEQGKGVSVSSLRADRLDEEFVWLLKQGGYRAMTVASDAPSERQRSKLMKGIRERHLLRAAHLSKWAGMKQLKVYMILGLPDETEEDIDELLGFSAQVAAVLPMALTLSPFVPKLHTPLCGAPFEDVRCIDDRLQRIRRSLGGKVDVRSASGKWAWVEYRLSQGGPSAGLAAWEGYRNGGSYAAYRAAFLAAGEERAALDAALRHGVWQPTGVNPDMPAPPRPPKRLQWSGVEVQPRTLG
jgi:radical SAM superfamily enzyme YgiQ (UPF0313 family)